MARAKKIILALIINAKIERIIASEWSIDETCPHRPFTGKKRGPKTRNIASPRTTIKIAAALQSAIVIGKPPRIATIATKPKPIASNAVVSLQVSEILYLPIVFIIDYFVNSQVDTQKA